MQDFKEQWTNWSSGLAIWDYIHGTYRFGVPQASLTIGLPGIHQPDQAVLTKLIEMPFRGELTPLPDSDLHPTQGIAGPVTFRRLHVS